MNLEALKGQCGNAMTGEQRGGRGRGRSPRSPNTQTQTMTFFHIIKYRVRLKGSDIQGLKQGSPASAALRSQGPGLSTLTREYSFIKADIYQCINQAGCPDGRIGRNGKRQI